MVCECAFARECKCMKNRMSSLLCDYVRRCVSEWVYAYGRYQELLLRERECEDSRPCKFGCMHVCMYACGLGESV